MQIIDVLGNQQELALEVPLKAGQCQVGGVGGHLQQLLMPLIVEAKHLFRVADKGLRRGDILHPVPFPQTIRPPECLEAGLGRNPGARQHHHPLHSSHALSKPPPDLHH